MESEEVIYIGIGDINLRDSLLKLNINVDSLPIFNSTNNQFWPILGQIGPFNPCPIAIFCAETKLESLPDFSHGFIIELNELIENKEIVNEKRYSFEIGCFTWDAPVEHI